MSEGASTPREPSGTLLAGAFAVFAVALVFQLPFFDRWFSPMDEGHILYFAELVLGGGQLYRDATIYPLPGAFLFLAAVFRFFEPSILLTRWIVAIQFAVFAALVYALVRGVVSRAWAWGCVGLLLAYRIWAFPHWHMYNYSTTALLLLFGALLALVGFFRSGRRRTLGFAGLLFGLGVFCKQDYGAAALLAIVFSLIVFARSGPAEARTATGSLLVSFLAPAAGVGAAAGLYFLQQGMLMHVIQFTVLNHFIGLSTYEYPAFPSLLPLLQQDPAVRSPAGLFSSLPGILQTVALPEVMKSDLYKQTFLYDLWVKLFIFGPRLFVAGGALRLWLVREEIERPATRQRYLVELAIWAFAAALMLLAAVYRPQDYVHLAVLYAPLFCLVVIYAEALARSHARAALLSGIALALPLTAFVVLTGWLAWNLRVQHSEPVGLARADVYVKPDEALLLRDAVAYIEETTRPGETVAVVPYYPILHFLTQRPGPHGAAYIVWPFAEYPDRDRLIIDAMERNSTSTVIYNFTEFPAFPPAWEYAPELIDYLVDHFEIERVFSYHPFGQKLAALRRSERPAEGEPIRFGSAGATVTILAEDGTRREVSEPAEYAADTRWPFRNVLALRPTTHGDQTELAIPLEVPAGAILRTAIGVHPNAWYSYPPSSIRFGISVQRDGARDLLFSRELDPHLVMADRGWFPLEVPLDAYAGQQIRLVFHTAAQRAEGERLEMGGWGEPRLVVPDPAR